MWANIDSKIPLLLYQKLLKDLLNNDGSIIDTNTTRSTLRWVGNITILIVINDVDNKSDLGAFLSNNWIWATKWLSHQEPGMS